MAYRLEFYISVKDTSNYTLLGYVSCLESEGSLLTERLRQPIFRTDIGQADDRFLPDLVYHLCLMHIVRLYVRSFGLSISRPLPQIRPHSGIVHGPWPGQTDRDKAKSDLEVW